MLFLPVEQLRILSKKEKKRSVDSVCDRGRESGRKKQSIVVWVSCSRDSECCIELHN